jgi:hypothetical protein
LWLETLDGAEDLELLPSSSCAGPSLYLRLKQELELGK